MAEPEYKAEDAAAKPEIYGSVVEAEDRAEAAAGEDHAKPEFVESVKESLIEAEEPIASFLPESLISEVESVLPTSDTVASAAGESSEPPETTEVSRALDDEGEEEPSASAPAAADGSPAASSWKDCCGLLSLFTSSPSDK